VLDLFSGIGGFSLGLERTGGFETAAFCEYAEWPRKVLAKHWPNVPIFDDVRILKGSDIDGPIDVICGGYPCQPFSTAGRRKGQEDDRHLWPEFNRLVVELRPTWVIGENVAGHISMGLDDVLSDLERQGYAARTFVVPACATGAPHRRDRVWTVANASGRRSCKSRQREEEQPGRTKAVGGSKDVADAPQLQRDGGTEHPEQSERQFSKSGKCSGADHVAHSDDARLQGWPEARNTGGFGARGNQHIKRCGDNQGPAWIAEPGMGGMAYGLPAGMDGPCRWPPEPDIPRVAKGVKDRANRLKALGNAVVPQIPEMIGWAILEAEAN